LNISENEIIPGHPNIPADEDDNLHEEGYSELIT